MASGITEFRIINAETARFECNYGRGCDGYCCREGRPLLYQDETERLEASRSQWLPLLRKEAQKLLARKGFATDRRRFGQRLARKAAGWCVFFNRGCVLHKLGAARNAKFDLKPAVCALFPIQQDEHDRWFIRQKGFNGERWDLHCLDPSRTTARAAETLVDEIALARHFHIQECSKP